MSPSDMIEDQPVHMDHVHAIEATMDEMKSQHEATHQLLQDILARLGPAQAQNVQDPLPTRPACGSPTPSVPADESLTSLAVYFRNWHMFREYMNNIPC